MNDRTIKENFNKKAKKPTIQRNYSHKELIEKIDRYASVAKAKDQKKEMLDIKERHIKRTQELPGRRFARNLHYQQGIRRSIHPRETLENLNKQDKLQDQRDRNRVVKKAKDYYHKNYSLTKLHSDATKDNKSKDISKDKG